MEFEAADIVPPNPFDLAGRTLLFAPDGRGGYARAVGSLDWDLEDRGERTARPAEIELKHFEFEFSGRKWRSLFLSRSGLITFGRAFPEGATPRFGTMEMIAEAMVTTPTISALYKPYLRGNIYVSDLPDRVVITYYAWDWVMTVYGRRPKETFDYQVVLHSDGRVAFNYGPDPADADEAFRDGIVGLFPTDPTTGEPSWTPDRVADLSRPDSRFSAAQTEVFSYPAIRDRGEGVADVSCRIIEVLGDEFDFFAFNSQSRVDQQEHGPAHGFGGWYPGNQTATGLGREPEPHRVTPCESRLTNSWGFPVWMKARTVVNEGYVRAGHQSPYDSGLTYFAHEIAHTWLAAASYLAHGERTPMQQTHGASHWAFALHAPAPFPWGSTENGSVMGGAYWRENSDGTFSPTDGWWTKAGGFSWLDLYLMGLATAEEVPDMFILRNLQQVTSDPAGPHTGEQEIITMDQIIAAIGSRDPPPEIARKVFNVGFVYFLLPGETPDPGLLREHANYRDRALDHWDHITGGRGQLTTELPATSRLGVPTGAVTEPFLDLDRAGVHRSAVQSLAAQGVFEGTECAPGKFCPRDAVERWAMAVWLVRILDGGDPPSIGPSRFVDVDASQWWAPYVERLADLGVTAGCATEPARFCPDETTSRGQMASFLVAAFDLRRGRSGRFTDTRGSVHEHNIDALAAAGVTAGCGTGPPRYCPGGDTSRAEMATFLTRGLGLEPPPEHVVRVLYAVPADREFSSGSREGIRRAVEHVQSWYHQQLEGATFSLHDPIVEDCRMRQPEDYYARGHAWNKVVEGVQHCAPVSGWAAGGTHDNPGATTTWVIYPDVEEACDEYHQLGEAGHELGRGGWGMTLLGRDDVEGVADPGGQFYFCGEGPYDNSFARWIGGLAHELGHALGLPHPPGCDEGLPSCDKAALMGSGFAAYPDTYLREDDKAILLESPFITQVPPPLPPLVDIPPAIRGRITDADGRPVSSVWLGAWQSDNTDYRRFVLTHPDGTFVLRIPDGSYRLHVYAAPGGACAGYYNGESITTNYHEALIVTVEGTDIEGITIRLPASPQKLPAVQC